MTLTDDEKARIRMYLGWTARFSQTDTALERAMSALDMMPSELVLTREHLAELTRIDAAIVTAEGRFKADQVGSITLSQSELSRLRSRGHERCARLARQLGVPMKGGPFSPSQPSAQAGRTGPISGGGNGQLMG